jgi:hypothetical protein
MLCFGYDRAIFDRVMPLGLWIIPIICSFRSFSCTGFTYILKWNLAYRFIIRIHVFRSNCVLGTIEPFWPSYAPWTLKNYNNLRFPFTFFALVGHIEMKFGIQVYHKNILVKLCFGYHQTIFEGVMLLGLRKFPIICSFYTCS